ncbi:MAG: chlorophyll a/b-binding protein [Cyanobacteria bacterium J06597_16]
MKNNIKSVPSNSRAAAAALDSKTLGVSATRYYKPEPRMGFTPYAELWNGRLAMLGIFGILAYAAI